jgi:hypothetical protein
MAIELPSPPVDLSAIFSQIETDCEAIALLQVKARLAAYTEAVGKLDGNKYQKWQHLPVKALNSLAAKLKKELEVLTTVEKPKAIAPPVDVTKSDDFF